MEIITNTTGTNLGYTMSSATYPVLTSWTTNPEPRPPTPLEWLDAEVERTCSLARQYQPQP